MSDYVDKHFGKEFLSSSDKSLKSQGGCQKYRPDKLYISQDLVIILECDEHQHKHSSGNYSCDEKRISDIYNEQCIVGEKLSVVRWNPDKYKGKKNRTTRLEELVVLMKKIIIDPQEIMIKIYYMYYDDDNPHITKAFTKIMSK